MHMYRCSESQVSMRFHLLHIWFNYIIRTRCSPWMNTQRVFIQALFNVSSHAHAIECVKEVKADVHEVEIYKNKLKA